ncbi:MAG: periplasmic heavy metal sensor [Coxiellaceae bacterium]|nr:periplasmic heavy metal sensor [Coxiellaceae bacterium]
MNTSRFITAGIAAAALLGGTTVAMASSHNKSGKCHMPHQLKQQLKKLSPDQRATVMKTFKAGREKARTIRQQLHAKRAMLNALLLQKNNDPAKVKSVVDEISALQKQLLQTAVDTRMQISKDSGVYFELPAKRHGGKCSKKCHGKYQGQKAQKMQLKLKSSDNAASAAGAAASSAVSQ